MKPLIPEYLLFQIITMLETGHTQTEAFKARKLWATIEKSVAGTKVINPKDNFPPQTQAVITLCPLYADGALEQSAILQDPQSLHESRVRNKWPAAYMTLQSIKQYVDRTGGDLSVTAVFADKGVILPYATDEDRVALSRHSQVYQAQLQVDLGAIGVPLTFTSYSELGIPFQDVISPYETCPEELYDLDPESRMIEWIKMKLGLRNLSYSAKHRDIMLKLAYDPNFAWGEALTAGMIASYLAFDSTHLPHLGNIYLSTERIGELHYLTGFNNLGQEAQMTRALIPA